MRGQFFVISAVIIISAIVLIAQYLYDFGRTNLTGLAEFHETNYVRYVQMVLNNTAATNCTVVDAELNATEKFLIARLAERGMRLDVAHNRVGLPPVVVNINFNITAPGFSSQTAFATLCKP
ncbi:MAG: hypothetical protein QW751_02145 [Candidatus Aenigmatarchaeota archaeon]|nr:hypothetical protein [Candidatus Aenigmarchaeota archaeon]